MYEYDSPWLMIGKQILKCLIAKDQNITGARPPSPQGEGQEGEVKKSNEETNL